MSTTTFSSRLTDVKNSGFSMKYSDFDKLEGQDDYRTWSSELKHIFKAMGPWDIDTSGVVPPSDADTAEKSAYRSLKNTAAAALIQVVSKDIKKQIVELESPHAMWQYLKDQYHRDNAYSFVSQLKTFTAL